MEYKLTDEDVFDHHGIAREARKKLLEDIRLHAHYHQKGTTLPVDMIELKPDYWFALLKAHEVLA